MQTANEIKYKAVKYIRLSSADDNKQGESDSVVNQRKLIDDYLSSHPEIEVAGEFVDDGVSGVVFDRPSFNAMMNFIQDGKANCIISKDAYVMFALRNIYRNKSDCKSNFKIIYWTYIVT